MRLTEMHRATQIQRFSLFVGIKLYAVLSMDQNVNVFGCGI